MDGIVEHYGKWNKANTERQALHILTCGIKTIELRAAERGMVASEAQGWESGDRTVKGTKLQWDRRISLIFFRSIAQNAEYSALS